MTTQIHRVHKRPPRKEIFQIWNAAKHRRAAQREIET